MRHCHPFLAAVVVVVVGCLNDGGPVSERRPAANEKGFDARTANEPVTDADRSAILDAVLCDALAEPSFKDSRNFYGTAGDKRVALVLSKNGASWPDWYRPRVDGYEVVRLVEDTNVNPASPRLLGIRLDKFNLSEEPNQFFDGQIRIVMLNAGGDGGGNIIEGGCDIYYDAKRDGDKWTVESNGLLDP